MARDAHLVVARERSGPSRIADLDFSYLPYGELERHHHAIARTARTPIFYSG